MSILPDGYEPGACKPIDPVTDALATVDCEKNTKPGGPEVARYSLFPDQATLDRHFETAIKEDDQLQNCPGSDTPSPTTWHYTSTPDKVEGQVACGTYKGGPDMRLDPQRGPDAGRRPGSGHGGAARLVAEVRLIAVRPRRRNSPRLVGGCCVFRETLRFS